MERRTYTKEEISEKLDLLPEATRNFIYSNEIDAAIQQIAQKHQLHIDQMGLLQADVVDVMIGTTQQDEFVPYLIETLEIDGVKADSIAEDVNALIFNKIRESMKQASGVSPVQTENLPSVIQPVSTPKTPPKPEFPAADVMLSQKTVTAPVPLVAPVVREVSLQIPVKLQPATMPPPILPTTPSSFSAPVVQVSMQSAPSSVPQTIPTVPSTSVAPTPQHVTPAPEAPRGYKTDPYREPIE